MLLGQQIHMNEQWLNIKRTDCNHRTKYSKTNEKSNKQTNRYDSPKMDRNYLGFCTALTEMRDESAGILYRSWRSDGSYMECVAPLKPSRLHDDNYMKCVTPVKPSRLHDDKYVVFVALLKQSQVPGHHDENYVECVAIVKPLRLSAFHHNNCNVFMTVIRLHRA